MIANTYDDANRLTDQGITLAGAVAGETAREFQYDPLNRMTQADNNYASVDRAYDALSRMTQETQSIRLDGTGFDNGWERDIALQSSQFDKDSNRGRMVVLEIGGGSENLRVNSSFDDMSRTDVIDAEYFAGSEAHEIVDYNYFGPSRIQTKTFGNDAVTSVVYDGKRRISEYTTRDATMAQNLLVGYEYDYDDVDNPLWQQTKHDNNYYEEYNYDNLYRLTNVIYRDNTVSPIDYRTYSGSWTPGGGNYASFTYDALGNRTASTDGDPFGTGYKAATVDSYTINSANEYTQITRDSTNMNPVYDRAGNMTTFPTRPAAGTEASNDVNAAAVYDAFNQSLEVQAGSNSRHHYRYDALGRRIVSFERGATAGTPEEWTTGEGYQNYTIDLGRRYIWDGWTCVVERQISPGTTEAVVVCELERIYVHGPSIDEPLFCAIDGDLDGDLAELHEGTCAWDGSLDTVGCDKAFYYYTNRMGSIAALANRDDDEKLYEYYRYRAYGEMSVYPILDANSNGIEDTGSDLGDNPVATFSQVGNQIGFQGREHLVNNGNGDHRRRMLNHSFGAWTARDPLEYVDGLNLYVFTTNRPTMALDYTGGFVFVLPLAAKAAAAIGARILASRLLQGVAVSAVAAPAAAPHVKFVVDGAIDAVHAPAPAPAPAPQPTREKKPFPGDPRVEDRDYSDCELWKEYCRYITSGSDIFNVKSQKQYFTPDCSLTSVRAQALLALPDSNKATCRVKYKCCVDAGAYFESVAVPYFGHPGGGTELRIPNEDLKSGKCIKVDETNIDSNFVGPPGPQCSSGSPGI